LKGRLQAQHGAALYETLRSALAAPTLDAMPERRESRSGPGRMNDRQQATYDALKNWRKERAATLQMDAAYVLPRRALEFLALHPVGDPAGLIAVPEIDAWRIDQLGEEILAVLRRVGAKAAAPSGENTATAAKRTSKKAARKKVPSKKKASKAAATSPKKAKAASKEADSTVKGPEVEANPAERKTKPRATAKQSRRSAGSSTTA
jgi:ribonuclease D